MDTILIFLLLTVGFLSFVPVINMNKNQDDLKYRCLKYLINTAFAWTILIFIERLSGNVTVVYYAHVLGYPVKFLLASFMICTIFNYIEKPMPKPVFYFFGVIFIGELIFSLTNTMTKWFIIATPETINGLNDLYQAANGPIFTYHLILIYLILFIGIGYLFYFLAKHRDVRQYKLITQTMAISVVVVLGFNLFQLLVIKTNLDLTYVSLIVVSYALYRAIYKKDMVFNLKTSGRGEILSNMREMYILTDADRHVIEISNLLLSKYNINFEEYAGKDMEKLITKLEEYIVFYNEYQVDTDAGVEKDHFHLREKQFSLKGMNDFGYMILLYDETQVFGLLRELNKLSNYDNMTGLNNRNYMESILPKLNKTTNLGVISLDLNGLKANNDYLGHERGDYLLKSLASKMKIVMQEYQDKEMARIGGDEFLIILKNTTLNQLNEIKEAILQECNNNDLEKRISVSIGVAYSVEECNVYQLIQKADENMYAMKKTTSQEYSRQIVEYAKKQDVYIR